MVQQRCYYLHWLKVGQCPTVLAVGENRAILASPLSLSLSLSLCYHAFLFFFSFIVGYVCFAPYWFCTF